MYVCIQLYIYVYNYIICIYIIYILYIYIVYILCIYILYIYFIYIHYIIYIYNPINIPLYPIISTPRLSTRLDFQPPENDIDPCTFHQDPPGGDQSLKCFSFSIKEEMITIYLIMFKYQIKKYE